MQARAYSKNLIEISKRQDKLNPGYPGRSMSLPKGWVQLNWNLSIKKRKQRTKRVMGPLITTIRHVNRQPRDCESERAQVVLHTELLSPHVSDGRDYRIPEMNKFIRKPNNPVSHCSEKLKQVSLQEVQ